MANQDTKFTHQGLDRVRLDSGEAYRLLYDPKDKSLRLRVQPKRKTWVSRVNGSDTKSILIVPSPLL